MDYDFDRIHQQSQQILARYVEKLRQGAEAARMYPEVESHLKECDHCRTLLEMILENYPDSDVTAPPSQRRASLTFLQHQAPPFSTIRPGSSRSSFGIHITIAGYSRNNVSAMSRSPLRGGPMRGPGPVLPGGRLLYSGSHRIDDLELHILLTLQPADEPDRYLIVGEVFSDHALTNLDARLRMGDETYHARLIRGRFVFGTICDPHFEPITLSLETPDQ